MDSSSKVTVEYHDPSGIFPILSRDIYSRLPLRHLNWRSLNRPLRQIKSLHLDFVPDAFTKKTLQPPVPQSTSERNTSFDIVGNGTDQRKQGTKERRHQIPGLQTSPYLKVYILRCDDKAAYKESERAKVREWIRQGTASKQKGNHDAFEWLILHVVVPDTLAASEPRWREARTEDTDDLKERPKQGTKWPGKSSRTVFDKLRADFNESGKNGQDRVAQIRFPKDQFPVDLLPTPAVAGTLKETPEEREKAWIDLITKIRTLILDPFDKRVKQYEADIAEQESRRSMPGFNFCTFFIYKEGLAKALESIGLIEDALVIYDELALGLEIVLRDIASGRAEGTATTFAPYMDDIVERLVGSKDSRTNGSAPNAIDALPSENSEKLENDYREKIVRSSISVFDFFSYLFSRQKTIILRLANAKAARIQLGLSPKGGSEDLVLISEVCWRAASFIHNNARLLRQDLLTCRAFELKSNLSDADVDSLVSLWIYEAAGKVLDETASFALDNAPEPGSREYPNSSPARSPKSAQGLGGLSAYPSRTSSLRTTSLPPRNSRVSSLQNKASLQSASENDLMSRPSSSGTDESRHIGIQPGFAELVTYRASLVMMQRKALELLAKQRGWATGWASVKEDRNSHMDDVDLNGDSNKLVNGDSGRKKTLSSLLSPALATALSSEQHFHEAYARLSEQAMRYHITATQAKAAETIIGDLAILKYQQGDFENAVTYFQHILPLYSEGRWSLMEFETLNMHAKCLKELGRREDYLKASLQLLAKTCEKKPGDSTHSKLDLDDSEAYGESRGLMAALIAQSREMDTEVMIPAEQFFSDVLLHQVIQHHENQDGFAVRLSFEYLPNDDLQLDHVRVRLVCVEDRNQEILLVGKGPLHVQHGSNTLELESNAVACGAYRFERLVLEAGNLLFERDFQSNSNDDSMAQQLGLHNASEHPSSATQRSWLFLYPAQDAFNAELSIASDIQLDERRSLEMKLSSGWNEIETIDLRLKPASAGLRLHLADFKTSGINPRGSDEPIAGQVALGGLKAYESALVEIPYTIEQTGQEIVVRLEAHYRTTRGSFVFLQSFKLPTKLPLSVDVNDIFHYDALFSSFTVRATDATPLCITHVELESTAKYEVTAPRAISIPMPVLEDQPVRLLYKVARKGSNSPAGDQGKKALALVLTYHLLEEALSTVVFGKFMEAVEESPFAKLSRLLIYVLLTRTKSFWSPADIEMALLLNESKIPTFEDVGWEEIIPTLPPGIQSQLTTWLREWHRENTTFTYGSDTGSVGCVRSISISVDVPHVDVVHKASLKLRQTDEHIKHYPPIFTLGMPITAQLRITSTDGWSAITHQSTRDKKAPKRFRYEVHADPDAWLIGGQRRGHFAFEENGEMTSELLLIPLRLDYNALPQVDVQPDTTSENAEGASASGQGSQVTSETHYESAGEVVQIIRNTTTSRIHIPEMITDVRPPSRSGGTPKGKEVG